MSAYTDDKILEIKELMRRVNVSEMCRRAGVKRRIYYAVIAGESSRYEVVEAVEKEARKELRRMKRQRGSTRSYNRAFINH